MKDHGSGDEDAVEILGVQTREVDLSVIQCGVYAWRTVEKLYDKEGRRWWKVLHFLAKCGREKNALGEASAEKLGTREGDRGDVSIREGERTRLVEPCRGKREEVQGGVRWDDGPAEGVRWNATRPGDPEASEERNSAEEQRKGVHQGMESERKKKGRRGVSRRPHHGLRMSGVKGRVWFRVAGLIVGWNCVTDNRQQLVPQFQPKLNATCQSRQAVPMAA